MSFKQIQCHSLRFGQLSTPQGREQWSKKARNHWHQLPARHFNLSKNSFVLRNCPSVPVRTGTRLFQSCAVQDLISDVNHSITCLLHVLTCKVSHCRQPFSQSSGYIQGQGLSFRETPVCSTCQHSGNTAQPKLPPDAGTVPIHGLRTTDGAQESPENNFWNIRMESTFRSSRTRPWRQPQCPLMVLYSEKHCRFGTDGNRLDFMSPKALRARQTPCIPAGRHHRNRMTHPGAFRHSTYLTVPEGGKKAAAVFLTTER